MFHFASLAGDGGVPRGAPLGHGPCGPRPPPPCPADAPGAAPPGAAPPGAGGAPPAGGAAAGAAPPAAGVLARAAPGSRGGTIHPRYCTPPLIIPVPFISSFISKSAASPPCQTRYTV